MTDALALHGPVGDYARAAAAKDFAEMERIALAIMAADEVVLPHPEKPEILCRCRSSLQRGMRNCLFLSDENGGNRWCLVQHSRFIQFIVTQTGAHHVSVTANHLMTSLVAQIRAGDFDAQWERRDSYGGLSVRSSRPYHFFYDQFVQLPDVIAHLPKARQVVHVGNDCFMSPTLAYGIAERAQEDGRYYLVPTRVSARRTPTCRRQAKRMEAAMSARISATPPEPRPGLSLWIGITGQKRAWIEQVEGYVAIVRALAKQYPDLVVYIDGMTAPHGERIENRDDEAVAAAIIRGIADVARAQSLVGMDYVGKIALCHGVDAFIANGGTGCFVPLRICRKPGVLHSNHNLWVFADLGCPEDVIRVDREVVSELPAASETAPKAISYSIAWEEIFNRLVTVLPRAQAMAPPQRVPSSPAPAETTGPDEGGTPEAGADDPFADLPGLLKTRLTAEAILRRVAVLFEKSDDFTTALAVLERAHRLNPDSPEIARRLAQCRARSARRHG